jgi:Tol biopolymer transport system component
MNANGTAERRLLKNLGWSPAWSPDGKSIAYVSDKDGDDEIYSVGANGSGVAQLTENEGIADDDPTWSPDSSLLAFSSNRDGDGDIFEMQTDGSSLHVIVSGVWTDDSPAWRR